MELNKARLEQLENSLKERVLKHEPGKNFQRLMTLDQIDRRIYAIYLSETFHYTRHNTKNQALVACRDEFMDVNYMKFCLNHAQEEAGHEYMALSDLNSLGIKFKESDLPSPLPETDALIGYIYRTATTGNALARLGYSYWAESIYGHTKNGTFLFKEALRLKDSQMTFLIAHSKIDKEHFEDIQIALSRFAKTDEDWTAVETCMLQSLDLTRRMVDQVIGNYLNILDGIPTKYDIFAPLMESKV